MSKNVEKLTTLLGFNPTKKARLTTQLFADLTEEINTKRIEAAKERAKVAITAAVALQEQMEKSEKDFKQAHEKFEKELGKLVNEIKNQLDGQAPDPEPAAEGNAPPAVENPPAQ